ncbi:hypothetical protein [Paracidovorax anthurii]|uniref:hypothetical protein n=1 Tax=Paracidovorax anthurii TaxID=78229 RepID=UPI0011BDAFC4|nr:hypothetical protein [Paracidovorax anthurii]
MPVSMNYLDTSVNVEHIFSGKTVKRIEYPEIAAPSRRAEARLLFSPWAPLEFRWHGHHQEQGQQQMRNRVKNAGHQERRQPSSGWAVSVTNPHAAPSGRRAIHARSASRRRPASEARGCRGGAFAAMAAV